MSTLQSLEEVDRFIDCIQAQKRLSISPNGTCNEYDMRYYHYKQTTRQVLNGRSVRLGIHQIALRKKIRKAGLSEGMEEYHR